MASGARATNDRREFRYIPGFLLLLLVVDAFFAVYGMPGLVVLGLRYGWLYSPKGFFLLALGVVGTVMMFLATAKVWQLHWRFIVTPTHLIALHSLRRLHVEIPWEGIVAVRRLPRPWWARGGGGLGISEIETTTGDRVPFMTHLMIRYGKFLGELRTRAVKCKQFDPYSDEWS